MLDFKDLGLWLISGLFALSAVVVWMASAEIRRDPNIISEPTGMGQTLDVFYFLRDSGRGH